MTYEEPPWADPVATAAVCWPTIWGNGKIDRRRGRKRHAPILQPFYNQDFRLWCPRCGLLAKREAFSV